MVRIILYWELLSFQSPFSGDWKVPHSVLGPEVYGVPEQSWIWKVVVPASQVCAEKLEWPKPNLRAEEGKLMGSSVSSRIFSGSFVLPFVSKYASLDIIYKLPLCLVWLWCPSTLLKQALGLGMLEGLPELESTPRLILAFLEPSCFPISNPCRPGPLTGNGSDLLWASSSTTAGEVWFRAEVGIERCQWQEETTCSHAWISRDKKGRFIPITMGDAGRGDGRESRRHQ